MTIAHLKGELFQVSYCCRCFKSLAMNNKCLNSEYLMSCPTILQVKAVEDGADMTVLLQELEEAKRRAISSKEELKLSLEHQEKLQEDVQAHEVSLSKLTEELQEMRSSLDVTKEELTKYQQHNEKLQEDVKAREVSLSKLTEELQEMRKGVDASKEELTKYQQHNEELREEVHVREGSLSEVREELQEMRSSVEATKEELRGYRQQNEKLLEELRVREISISRLKEELEEARTALLKTSESVPPSPSPSPSPHLASSTSTAQPKRKRDARGGSAKEKPSVSRKNSAPSSQSPQSTQSSDQQGDATTDSSTQTEPVQETDLSQSAANEQLEDVIGEFQDKIAEMQELHAAEILDMEARHISESENLRRDTQALEDKCKSLKAVIDKLYSTEVSPGTGKRLSSSKASELPHVTSINDIVLAGLSNVISLKDFEICIIKVFTSAHCE